MVKKSTLDTILQEEMSDIWALLNNEEKRELTDNFRIQHYKKNEIIYSEGDEARYLMCLIKGKVKIYKDGVGGRCQIIRLIRPVQYFGYRAYFAQETYVTAAAAFETAIIGFLPMSVVESFTLCNNQVAQFFIRNLAVDLGISDERTVSLTQKHIRGRLEDDGATLNIYMAREDLANLSNMTTSNAIRTLTCFANEKILIIDGRKIKILDEESLHNISKFG